MLGVNNAISRVVVEAVVLGFQHYLLSLGITVLIPSLLVPIMGGGDVSFDLTLISFMRFLLIYV